MGILEDIHTKLDQILVKLETPVAVAAAIVKEAKERTEPAPKAKAAAKKEAAPPAPEIVQELEDETDPFAVIEEEPLTPAQVADSCKKLMDGITDKKAFRTAFVELLKNKFNVDNVAKVPVEKLGQLMSEIEKIGATLK